MNPGKKKGSVNRGRWLGFLATRVIGLLFVFAGALKAWDPAEFAKEISRYQLVSWPVAVGAALYLPWLEMLSGMLLLFRRFERGALVIITFLLGGFTVALGSALVRGLNIDCGCFGQVIATTGVVYPLIRNVILLLCVAGLWIGGRGNEEAGSRKDEA